MDSLGNDLAVNVYVLLPISCLTIVELCNGLIANVSCSVECLYSIFTAPSNYSGEYNVIKTEINGVQTYKTKVPSYNK